MPNIAVVGLGYWGPNLARNVASLPEGRLHTLCDLQEDRLGRMAAQYPEARTRSDFASVLADEEVDAVIVASPANTHFDLASRALQAGKHVMVEKPLAQTDVECRKLISLADERRLVLMVGHVFLYNAAVRKVKEYIDSGELGEIFYVYSQRLNLGVVRQDVNALWNFAPHDFSILIYWLESMPERVMARGYSYLQPGIEDVVFVTLDFPGTVGANVHLSWLDPNKVRQMTVVGSKKMVVYDDTSPDAKIKLYDKGVTTPRGAWGKLGAYERFSEFQLMLRAGDVLIPKLDFAEPLRAECQHFVDCIRSGETPLSDGRSGLQVVQTLMAADRALATSEAQTACVE